MTLDDALLAFFRLTERFEGISPAVREFANEIGAKSTSKAAYWLDELDAEGLTYTPAAFGPDALGMRSARTRKLSPEGIRRARLLTAVAS
jgi:hypothetical protein